MQTAMVDVVNNVHYLNPRKGTETCMFLSIVMFTIPLYITLIPVRGRKLRSPFTRMVLLLLSTLP